MNSAAIMQLCENLSDESKAISDYTQAISMVEDEKLKDIFAEIRNDELGHAQKLIVALTEILGSEEPTVAQNMDSADNKGGDDN